MRNVVRLCLCMLLAALAGCGPGGPRPVTFAVGGAPDELDFWETVIDSFTAATGIAVEMRRQPTDTDQRRQGLVVALNAAQADPDVFLMDVAWIAQFAASDWLLPLGESGCSSPVVTDVFFPGILDLADRHKGRLIALPLYVDGGLLYYRTDLLAKHGFSAPPVTWDELARQAAAVQRKERGRNPQFWGFVWQGAQYEGLVCTFLEFAGSDGGIGIAEGKATLAGDANRRGLEFMRDCIARLAISPPSTYTEMKEEEVRTAFQQGGALFERNWPYAYPLHNADDSPVKGVVGIAPLPRQATGGSVSTLGGWHVGVSKFTDAGEGACRLVAYLTSYDVQKRLALRLGWNPGRRDVYADSAVTTVYPHFTRLRDVFEHARPRPVVPYYTQLSSVLQRHLNAALAGSVSAADALTAAEAEAQEIVTRYAGGK